MSRILHVINGWALGGIAQATLDLIKNTPQHEHYAIGYCWLETQTRKDFEAAGCKSIVTQSEHYPGFADKLKMYKIDIVHKQTGGGDCPEWVNIANLEKVPVVESIHCPRKSGIPPSFVAATVVTTQYVVEKNTDRPIDKIMYPCTLPFKEARLHPKVRGKRKVTVGRMVRYEMDKLPEVLTKVALLLMEYEGEIEFLIMGYPFNEKVFHSMQQMNIPDYCAIEGLQEDKEKALARLDICLDPVWETSFDMVMTEAMSQGIPVVTWEDSAAPEVCGKAGIVTERTAFALAQAVLKLVRSQEAYDTAAYYAYQQIRERHDPKKYGEQFNKVYERVLNGRSVH